MTKDEALKLALEAMTYADACLKKQLTTKDKHEYAQNLLLEAGTAIREALAQPEQEPVATLWQHGETGRTRITMPNDITDCDARWFKAADLYTTPPHRKPLTDEEIDAIYTGVRAVHHEIDSYVFTRAIEAAHGIKGEA